MSSLKGMLKSVNDAIRRESFDEAIAKAREVLVKEPKSYQG